MTRVRVCKPVPASTSTLTTTPSTSLAGSVVIFGNVDAEHAARFENRTDLSIEQQAKFGLIVGQSDRDAVNGGFEESGGKIACMRELDARNVGQRFAGTEDDDQVAGGVRGGLADDRLMIVFRGQEFVKSSAT